MAIKEGNLLFKKLALNLKSRMLRHSNSCKNMTNYVFMLISFNSILETQRDLKTDSEVESKQFVLQEMLLNQASLCLHTAEIQKHEI